MLAPAPPMIDLTAEWNGFCWRILVRGELDLRSGEELVDVAGILASGDTVELDLADVTFIDTAGWEAVAGARRIVESAGGASLVTATSPVVRRYLELVVGCVAGPPTIAAPR
jgi:anti-anti-sigma factor